MARRRHSMGNRPFQSLSGLLARKKIRLPQVRLPDVPQRPMTAAEERRLFLDAMSDVVPLEGPSMPALKPRRHFGNRVLPEDPDAEAYRQLKKLVDTGAGFVLRHTAEYVEGGPEWMPPELFRRIHGGYFSIQAHLDLHGLNLAAAKEDFDAFMQDSIASGKRAVLVVHGRGRCSPGKPVLKTKLTDWLTKGPWKRWVLAFTSARSCDGGTGATYVLLRRTPRSGKHR